MLTLAHAWLLVLLPLPVLVWWWVPPYRESRQGLVVPFMDRLSAILGLKPAAGATIAHANTWRWLVLWACWALVILAMARPQVIEPPVTKDIPVRDMLLAVDLSGSMSTKDFTDTEGNTVDRLTAVKQVLDGFLARREGDRVGLVFFGSAAFVQAPFTEDLDVVRQLLDEAQVRMAGPQTAFGDALGLAINVFERSTVEEKVLIALTDGNDTSSSVPPDKASQIARDQGIVIHTVAVGDPKAVGEDALDEVTLERVASNTGGIYSHASDRAQLEAIYDRLDQLETRKVQTQSHRPRHDVYWWPLGLAMGVSLGWLALGLLRSSGQARRARKAGESPAATLASVAGPPAVAAAIMPFHFIRPGWLLLLVPAALVWWRLHRHADERQAWRGIIAPHLLDHLLGGEDRKVRFGPLNWLGLLWIFAIVAIAGPTWKHEPSPFADDTAALAIVLKVTPSMTTEDVEPSRLERATQKIHDLLATRGTARSSLVAYAGSAHLVMPATRDGGIIDNFAQALDPDIMPVVGDSPAAALALADQSLADAGGGSIVWVTDGAATDQGRALADWRASSGTDLRVWAMLLPGDERDQLEAGVRPARADVIALSADDSDVQALARAAKFASTSGDGKDTRWAEAGYWLTPLLALLLLPFFRRGWLVPVSRAGA